MKAKKLTAIVAIALVVCMSIVGTLAWLTDKTDTVTNTFTVGKVAIDLTETERDYKMVPGTTLDKDPTVVVKSGSEACWLFLEVTKENNLDSFITSSIAEGWTALAGNPGVYYREVAATTADVSFAVLAGNSVAVKTTVTNEMLTALTDSTLPKLSFKAYAIQKSGFDTASAAWATAKTA